MDKMHVADWPQRIGTDIFLIHGNSDGDVRIILWVLSTSMSDVFYPLAACTVLFSEAYAICVW